MKIKRIDVDFQPILDAPFEVALKLLNFCIGFVIENFLRIAFIHRKNYLRLTCKRFCIRLIAIDFNTCS